MLKIVTCRDFSSLDGVSLPLAHSQLILWKAVDQLGSPEVSISEYGWKIKDAMFFVLASIVVRRITAFNECNQLSLSC